MTKPTGRSGHRSDIGPFGIVPRWVAERVTTASAYMVYGVLASYANTDTGRAFPSRTTLAETCKCSVKTIDRAIGELTEMGALIVQPRYEGGSDEEGARRQTSNAYTVIARCPDYAPPGDTSVPLPRDTSDAPGGDTSDAPGTTPVEQHHQERKTPARVMYDPVKGRRVDGQDLPWNALAAATSAYGEANGSRMRAALLSIRAEVWEMFVATSGHPEDELREIVDGRWQEYEERVAVLIDQRAAALIQNSPNLTWGPEGIARNWARAASLSSAGVEAVASQAVDLARLGDSL